MSFLAHFSDMQTLEEVDIYLQKLTHEDGGMECDAPREAFSWKFCQNLV